MLKCCSKWSADKYELFFFSYFSPFKFKCAPVHIEILNHVLCVIYRNITEEVNVKAHNIFLVNHQSLCNDIFMWTYRKHTNPLCGNIFPLYGILNFFFEYFLTLLIIQGQSPVIVLYSTPVVLNVFTRKLRVSLQGSVDNNMASTLFRIASIGMKKFCTPW